MIHIFHRYGPWKLTSVWRNVEGDVWRRYEVRRCLKCGWPQERLSSITRHRPVSGIQESGR